MDGKIHHNENVEIISFVLQKVQKHDTIFV